MSGQDRLRTEQIRALIEEVDRIRSEAEQMTSHVDRSMKHPVWPERRRSVRVPSGGRQGGRDETA